MMKKFEKIKDLDSMTFVEIPQKQIAESFAYWDWLVKEVEMKWMREFNKGNEHYHPHPNFNTADGIYGYFGGMYISHCKFYRFDGTEIGFSEDDYRVKRGFLIRDHYSPFDVVKVQLITDNLVEFLRSRKIEHNRRDFKRGI